MQNSFSLPNEKTIARSLTFSHYLALFALIFIAFFYGMSHYLIADLNEALYAEIAREMLVTHNYIIPHLNFVPYLEKPPLLYWLIAISYKLFGINTFAARLIPAASAGFICLFLCYFGQKIENPLTGWFAATILATSVGFILLGRVLIFDMLFTAGLTTALLFFYLWFCSDKARYLIVAYIAVALAFLTKGLLAIIVSGGTAIIFLFLTNTSSRKFRQFFNPIGIFLFLLIVVPWHIAAALQLPSFTWDYFVNEQWYRFIDKRFPNDYHTGPFYYYLPRIIVYLFPWSLLIPTLFSRIRGKIAQQNPLKILLWIWFLLPFCIFSISADKGDYYMLVAVPALALLLGIKFAEINDYRMFYNLLLVCGIILCSAALIGLHLHKTPTSVIPDLAITTIFLLIYFGLTLITTNKQRGPLYAYLCIAGFSFPLLTFYITSKVDMQNHFTQIALTQYIQTHDTARPVYLYQHYEDISSSLFFLKKRLYIVKSVSNDLYFGAHTPEANHWFISANDFLPVIRSKPIYIIVKKNSLNTFQRVIKPTQTCIVAQSDKTILLSNVKSECVNSFY